MVNNFQIKLEFFNTIMNHVKYLHRMECNIVKDKIG